MSRDPKSAHLLAAWMDGGGIDPALPHLFVDERALTVGEGVFETLITIGHRPFAVSRHIARLRQSAAVLGLRVGLPDSAIREGLDAVIEAATTVVGDEQLRLRITILGGRGPAGTTTPAGRAALLITASGLPGWKPTETVVTSPWPRNERSPAAGAKTIAYAENIVVARWAVSQGAGEALLANLEGDLCEATAANVFVEHEGRLVTPSLRSGCLAGVTRALLLELGVAEEFDVPLGAVAIASEAFLASTTRHVHPISAIDGEPMRGAPGPLTERASHAFERLIAHSDDP